MEYNDPSTQEHFAFFLSDFILKSISWWNEPSKLAILCFHLPNKIPPFLKATPCFSWILSLRTIPSNINKTGLQFNFFSWVFLLRVSSWMIIWLYFPSEIVKDLRIKNDWFHIVGSFDFHIFFCLSSDFFQKNFFGMKI